MKMKRVFAAAAAALVLATSAVCLTACGGDTGAGTGTVVEQQTDSLAGTTWDIVEVTMQGTTLTKQQMEDQLGGQPLDMYFQFTDTTVSYYLMGETDTTEYTYENGVLTIDGVSTTINGNTMNFNTGSEGYKLVKR